MADLYEILKRWTDRAQDWFRGVDWADAAFVAIAVPHIVVLLAIEGWVIWSVFCRG